MNTRRTHVINLIMDAATRTLRRGARAAVWSLMAVMMWSCASDEPTPDPNPGDKPEIGAQVRQIEIKAVIGTDGRGGSDDGYSRVGAEMDYEAQSTHFYWENGDKIGIYTTDPGDAAEFTITSIDDGVATLTGAMALNEGDTLYGVYPFVTSDALMLTQNGTLDGVGKCLLMTTEATTYKENEGITMKFQHETALMTFNLTFLQDVTEVTDICLENTQTKFSFTSSGGVTVEGSEPIKIAGPLKPDSEGKLALHVVLLPGSEFNKFNLTCTTDQGDYRMTPMSSTKKSAPGKHHRTSRTMAPYSPYEMAVVTTDGTSTAVGNIQHDHGKIKWFEDASLTAGTMITVCNVGVWKCFHALTDADIAQRCVELPDMNGGCTIVDTDLTRNDWIVALCMGGNVSTKINDTGVDKPLYWATGNLIAIAQEDGSTKFRLATLDEMKKSQTTDSPFRHNPEETGSEAVAPGMMWDMFLYGDPTGRKFSSTYKTTIPTSGSICGENVDIAHVQLGYSWRLPCVPQMLQGPHTTSYSKSNELWALRDCPYAGANDPLGVGWLTYGSNNLFFPLAGRYYSKSWHDVEKTGYFMTGNIQTYSSTKYVVYITVEAYTFASSRETAQMTGLSAFNVRPVTD